MPHPCNTYPIPSQETPDYATAQPGVFHAPEEHDLKSLSEEELFQSLLETGTDWTEEERAMVVGAYEIGRSVHWEDSHRDQLYTYHLLRNANRIVRYAHIRDPEIIAGVILHDAVEDHPDELAAYSSLPLPEGEAARRQLAYAFLEATFSRRVSAMVEGMTNPLPGTDGPEDYEQKIRIYVEHIAQEIRNRDVFFGKWSDWSDNGLGILHSADDLSPGRAAHFMYKYGLVLPVLEARYYEDDIQSMLDPVAKANIEQTFRLARQRLTVPG